MNDSKADAISSSAGVTSSYNNRHNQIDDSTANVAMTSTNQNNDNDDEKDEVKDEESASDSIAESSDDERVSDQSNSSSKDIDNQRMQFVNRDNISSSSSENDELEQTEKVYPLFPSHSANLSAGHALNNTTKQDKKPLLKFQRKSKSSSQSNNNNNNGEGVSPSDNNSLSLLSHQNNYGSPQKLFSTSQSSQLQQKMKTTPEQYLMNSSLMVDQRQSRTQKTYKAIFDPYIRLQNKMIQQDKRNKTYFQHNTTFQKSANHSNESNNFQQQAHLFAMDSQKEQVDKRVLEIINSVSYDTLVSIKKAVSTRESQQQQQQQQMQAQEMNCSPASSMVTGGLNGTVGAMQNPPTPVATPSSIVNARAALSNLTQSPEKQQSRYLSSLNQQEQDQINNQLPQGSRQNRNLHRYNSSQDNALQQNRKIQPLKTKKSYDDIASVIKDMNFNWNLVKTQDYRKQSFKPQGERFAMKEIRQKPEAQVQFNMIGRALKNEALVEGEQDEFMADGRMDPHKWFEDKRDLKDFVDDSPQKDLDEIKQQYDQANNMDEENSVKPKLDYNPYQLSFRKFLVVDKSEFERTNNTTKGMKKLKSSGSLDLGAFTMVSQLKRHQRSDSDLNHLLDEKRENKDIIISQNVAPSPIPSDQQQITADDLFFTQHQENQQFQDSDEIDLYQEQLEEYKDNEDDHKSDTLTNELMSARQIETSNLLSDEFNYYDKVIQERKHKLNTTILRFVDEQKYFNINMAKRNKKSKRFSTMCARLCPWCQKNTNKSKSIDFSKLTPAEKKERLRYLWFRARVIVNCCVFIAYLQRREKWGQKKRMTKFRLHVYHDHANKVTSKVDWQQQAKLQAIRISKMIWYSFISFWLWFNMITSPFIILWPELGSEELNKNLYYVLWLNELVWLLDIVRKIFDKPKKSRATDLYENAMAYFKSTLILDLISLLPQVASGLDAKFTPLKMVRLYQLWLLHYPFQVLLEIILAHKDKRTVYVMVYACQTTCRIFMLLHYLAIVWIWIGSDYFLDFEPGYPPFQVAIEDFEGYSKYRIYVFSVYWVCTVITTVGYGDYAGQTTLELAYSIFLEFFGLVVFSMLQVAVQQVVMHTPSYKSFISDMDNQIAFWLKELEVSNFPHSIPNQLYENVKKELWRSFRRDHTMVNKRYRFYRQLSPKLQNELVQLLFSDFLSDFDSIFQDCEQQFINNIVVMLQFNCYSHGQIIQTPMYECSEVHFIQTGGIAVCESSCFGEPVIVYGKGGAINLYQVFMQQKLDFKFVAVSKDSFLVNRHEKVVQINYNRNNSQIFTMQREDENRFLVDEIELYSLSGKKLR